MVKAHGCSFHEIGLKHVFWVACLIVLSVWVAQGARAQSADAPQPNSYIDFIVTYTPFPTPTAPWVPVPTPTPAPFVTRTPCVPPVPTPTPVCTQQSRGPFISASPSNPSVQLTQPFLINIWAYWAYDPCTEQTHTYTITYDESRLRLDSRVPDTYCDWGEQMVFTALKPGAAEIGVIYNITPPQYKSLSMVSVSATTPTVTFTPVRTDSPCPYPTLQPPTPTPECPQVTCTPAWYGPFYNQSSIEKATKVGDVFCITITFYYNNCCCCFERIYQSFHYHGDLLALLGKNIVEDCLKNEKHQHDWYFQALRPGTTNLNCTAYYGGTPYTYNIHFASIQIEPSATPLPTIAIPEGWILK